MASQVPPSVELMSGAAANFPDLQICLFTNLSRTSGFFKGKNQHSLHYLFT